MNTCYSQRNFASPTLQNIFGTNINLLFSHVLQSKFMRQDLFIFFSQRFHRYHSMAVESKTAEQKLQKMEDSRRKNEKMAKQFEKVPTVVMYREVLKELFRFLFEEL